MAVRIRLARLGRTHTPFYRVVAIDSREHREGRANEILGTYDPMLKDKNIQVDIERVYAWLAEGALLNKSVESLLKRFGYEAYPEGYADKKAAQAKKKKEKNSNRKKKESVKWSKPSRRSLNQHKAKLKAVRVADLAKELDAKKAAAEAAAAAEAPAEETAEA